MWSHVTDSVVRFRPKLGQISTKWDKSGTICCDQFSAQFGWKLILKSPKNNSMFFQVDPLSAQIWHPRAWVYECDVRWLDVVDAKGAEPVPQSVHPGVELRETLATCDVTMTQDTGQLTLAHQRAALAFLWNNTGLGSNRPQMYTCQPLWNLGQVCVFVHIKHRPTRFGPKTGQFLSQIGQILNFFRSDFSTCTEM